MERKKAQDHKEQSPAGTGRQNSQFHNLPSPFFPCCPFSSVSGPRLLPSLPPSLPPSRPATGASEGVGTGDALQLPLRVSEGEIHRSHSSEEGQQVSSSVSLLPVLTVLWNRMLGARVADLEHRLKVLEISGLWSASSSSGPVLDLTWNEDGKDGMELMTPHRDPHLPAPPHTSLAHQSSPPHLSSRHQLQLTPFPSLSSPSNDHQSPPQPSLPVGEKQVAPERGGEGEKAGSNSVEGTPVVLA